MGRKYEFCPTAQNTFFLLYYSDERFSGGDECVKTARSNFHPHSYTCNYQQFSSRVSLKIVTHRHSPSKTGGSHSLILTCEYAAPTSYIYAIAFPAGLNGFKLIKLIKEND